MHSVRAGVWPLLIAVLAASPVEAQLFTRPELPWETVRTAHFDVHFPKVMRPWALDAARRLESVRGPVTDLVGNAPAHRVTVVIDDPYNVTNGAALPVLNAPTIILWPTPPNPSEDLGHASDWAELLAVHEFAHIAHLTQPSRNPGERMLWHVLPVDLSPIARRSPRWIMEGYATYVEGRLTGSGRPNSAARAAVLRQWAIEGRLPTYAELDGSPRFLGGDMAYLTGSAFIEWLVARAGDESLPHLWRRMSARVDRDFAAAFFGVYGDTPPALYGRFTAELTGKALHAAIAITQAGLDTGETFQHLTWYTGDPAVSRDAGMIAVPVRSPQRPTRIVVWSTTPQNADSAYAVALARLRSRDPADVPALPVFPAPRRPLGTLEAVRGRGYDMPRFFGDGTHLLVSHDEPLPDGAMRPDLFDWNLHTGRVHRITHGAAVRGADPSPDGRAALGVRCDDGICDLVRIELATGRVQVLVPGSPTRQYYHPRFSADGRSAVLTVHDEHGWHLETMSVDDRGVSGMQRIGPSDGASRYGAVYVAGGAIVAVSELGGAQHLELIDIAAGTMKPLAATTGAIAAPDASPSDSTVYFLSLSARGRDLHRVATSVAKAVSAAVLPSSLAPATIPDPPAHIDSFLPAPLAAATPYGLGPREYRYLPGGGFGPEGGYFTLLLGSSDPIGRLDWTLQGSIGDRGTWRGGAAAAAWRGLPVVVGGSVFAVSDYPSRAGASPFVSDSLDADYRGAIVSGTLVRYGSVWSSATRVGASVGRIALANGTGRGRDLAFLGYAGAGDMSRGTVTVLGSAGALATVGTTDGSHWSRVRAQASLAAGMGLLSFRYTATYSQVSHGAPEFERPVVGGDTPPLTDTALLSQRMAVPGLPVGAISGRQMFGQRLEYNTGPLAVYYDRYLTPADRDTHHDLYGVEMTASVPPVPFLAVPSAAGVAGVAYSISAPFKYKLRAYLGVRYTP